MKSVEKTLASVAVWLASEFLINPEEDTVWYLDKDFVSKNSCLIFCSSVSMMVLATEFRFGLPSFPVAAWMEKWIMSYISSALCNPITVTVWSDCMHCLTNSRLISLTVSLRSIFGLILLPWSKFGFHFGGAGPSGSDSTSEKFLVFLVKMGDGCEERGTVRGEVTGLINVGSVEDPLRVRDPFLQTFNKSRFLGVIIW